MSLANVEIARRGLDAFNRRDVEAGAAVVAADFEWFPAIAEAVERGVYRGREGIEAYFADLGKTWEALHIRPERFDDLGDRVLMLGRIEGQGVGSGVPVEAAIGVVYELRGGRISRARGYLDQAEALQAAGLSGERTARRRSSPKDSAAMSENLAERVGALLRAADRADFDAILAVYAPDAVWVVVDADLRFEGVDAIRGLWQEWYGGYEDFRVQPREITDYGAGIVLALIEQGGHPTGSSAVLRENIALLYEWSRGRVVRVSMYFRSEDARAAAERRAAGVEE
jgi:ketosteroid isomerase-like protein